MISLIELKKYVTNANILSIIISKFCHRNKPYQFILLEINKNLKIGFYYIILPFNLAVRLQVEGNKKFPLDIEEKK